MQYILRVISCLSNEMQPPPSSQKKSVQHYELKRLLLLRELVGGAIMLLEISLGVRAIGSSSSFGMKIRTVAGLKVTTGAGS
jgi:hypothetical protein